MNEDAKHKSISFQADIDNFKTKGGVVTLQTSAMSESRTINIISDSEGEECK